MMTGKHVWWYFVAFFGFIAAVNAFMVTIAIRTHSGVVIEHAYEQGLAYNAVVAAEEKQEALGWHGRVTYAAGILRFSLRDKDNQPIVPDKATATITRPTRKGMDFSLKLTGEATPIDFPAHGLWEVRVDASHGGMTYQQSKRIVVQ